MPPKSKGEAAPPPNLIDRLFPAWNDADVTSDKNATGVYEDIDGLAFPAESKRWLDCWKRPGEVVLSGAKCEVVEMERVDVNGQKVAGGVSGRVFRGALYFGNAQFEWIMGVFLMIQQIQSQIPRGGYLFELIHPQAAGLPVVSPTGKYHVKLWVMDRWRRVVVDDRIPVDLFGRPLCVGSRPLQLWPILLSKAIFKVATAYHILGRRHPDQVPAFHWLTSWPLEDLVLPLNGISAPDGDLFDRLEASVRENPAPSKRRTITSVHLRVRAEPAFPPPRVFVLCGPPGVGTGAVLRSFVNANPGLFAKVVSHTTRAPKEHETDGVDYIFTDKPTLRSMQDAGEFLEVQKIATVHGREQLYGMSYASIRSVASGGKICVVAADMAGARALQEDDRIDALFVYVAPPNMAALERRLRNRLKEQESTIQKRLVWAQQQMDLARDHSLVDVVVANTDDRRQVYWDIKEAIATLSPIVRNRLHGIPAYILDYSDLIIANQVEKPFLKPVLLCGPSTTEKWEFLQTLADEFPDVFAFPQLYTDEPGCELPDPHDGRPELPAISTSARAVNVRTAGCAPLGPELARALQESAARLADPVAEDVCEDNRPHHTVFEPAATLLPALEGDDPETAVPNLPRPLPPSPVRMSRAEFDAMKDQFVEVHEQLFRHRKVTHRFAVRAEELQAIMSRGKLPLLDVELDSAQALRRSATECLTIFLAPPSVEAYRSRVVKHLTETERAIGKYMLEARRQLAQVERADLFHEIVVNDKLSMTTEALIDIAKKYRPDAYKDISTGEEDTATEEQGRSVRVVYIAGHPVLSNAEEVRSALIACCGAKLGAIPLVTSRKPDKAESDSSALRFARLPDLERSRAEGKVLSWREQGGDVYCTLLADAEALFKDTGKVAVVALGDAAALELAQAGPSPRHFIVQVAPSEPEGSLRAQQRLPPDQAADVLAAAAATADDLRIARVPTVVDDETFVAVADVRNLIAGALKHVLTPTPEPLVVAGPFSSGKRLLLQRMLTLYPDGFELPPLYTTHPGLQGPAYRLVDDAFLQDLRRKGHVVHDEVVTGHSCVLSYADVRRIAAEGRICLLEAESVEAVRAIRAHGLNAYTIHIGPASDEQLCALVQTEIGADPPPGYTAEEATQQFYALVRAELDLADAHPDLWDARIRLADKPESSYHMFMEAVADRFQDIVPPCHVWGFGSQLWDKSKRVHGSRPLNMMVLGPVAAGKTTVAIKLAERFGMKHINAGDLLFEEVRQRTKLGLRAKRYLDASKLVPDDVFNGMVLERLSQPDVADMGFLLDGYPHTRKQIQFLNDKGILPDKVIFMTATHATLLDRVKWRRVDHEAGSRPYHIPPSEPGAPPALSAAIRPLNPDGSVNEAVLARLTVRHDDTEDNVKNRLALWDLYNHEVRASYSTVSYTLAGTGDVEALVGEISQFVTLEERLADSVAPVASRSLGDLQYQVVDTMRFRRMPLVRLRQADGETFWVRLDELADNCQSMNMHMQPGLFQHEARIVHANLSQPGPTPLLLVNSPEPTSVVLNLTPAPQTDAHRGGDAPHQILFVTGAAGVGKSRLVAALRRSMPERLVTPQLLATARLPWADAVELIDHEQFARLEGAGAFVHAARLERGGARWALCADEVAACVRGRSGAFVVVEEHPEGVLAARAAGLRCLVVHVAAPSVDAQDQRLRLSTKSYEEAQISEFLTDGAAQVAALRAPGVCDLEIVNGDAHVAHAALRAFVTAHWSVRPAPEDCQALVEVYDWRRPGPYRTARRMQHVAASASTLDLPRGRHLLRVTVDPNYVHALTVWSNDAFKLQDAPELLRADEGAHVLEARDTLEAMSAGHWRVGCRQTFRAPRPCSVTVQCRCAPEQLQRQTRLVLLDNDTSAETPLGLGAAPRLRVAPNRGGYTIMAFVHAVAEIPASTWRIRLVSDEALEGFVAVPSARSEHFQGQYQPNCQACVWRYALAPIQACQVALRLVADHPGMAGRLRLEAAASMPAGKSAPAAGAAKKGPKGAANPPDSSPAASAPTVLVELPVEAETIIPVIQVPPGRHVLTLSLDRAACSFDIEPNGNIAEGSAAAAPDEEAAAPRPIRWSVFIAPTADEKACPCVADDSRERAIQATLKEWMDQGAGGAKERPNKSAEAMQRYVTQRKLLAEGSEDAMTVAKVVAGESVQLRLEAPAMQRLADNDAVVDMGKLLAERAERLQQQQRLNAAAVQLISSGAKDAQLRRQGELQQARALRSEQRAEASGRVSELASRRADLIAKLSSKAMEAR